MKLKNIKIINVRENQKGVFDFMYNVQVDVYGNFINFENLECTFEENGEFLQHFEKLQGLRIDHFKKCLITEIKKSLKE